MRSGKSYRIALCSMATTLAVVILAVGHSLSFGEFFWYFVASILIDLPDRTVDKAMCYCTSSVLSAILCGFNFVFLASYCLIMGPYVLISSAVENRSRLVRHLAVAVVMFLGITAVCTWTPMFLVQLSIAESASVRLTAIMIILGVSLVFETVYGRLFRFVKQILLKVWVPKA